MCGRDAGRRRSGELYSTRQSPRLHLKGRLTLHRHGVQGQPYATAEDYLRTLPPDRDEEFTRSGEGRASPPPGKGVGVAASGAQRAGSGRIRVMREALT